MKFLPVLLIVLLTACSYTDTDEQLSEEVIVVASEVTVSDLAVSDAMKCASEEAIESSLKKHDFEWARIRGNSSFGQVLYLHESGETVIVSTNHDSGCSWVEKGKIIS